MGHTNGTIKTQLGKFSEAFNLPWPKGLPIVLLNLKPTFGKHRLFPYEIVTSHSMNLDKGTYESILLKGDILHYDQGLINQITGTDKLVTFISQYTPENENFNDYDL